MTPEPRNEAADGFVARFDLGDAFWLDWWRNWLLYGTVYAINNPEPRIVPAETLTIHEGPCLAAVEERFVTEPRNEAAVRLLNDASPRPWTHAGRGTGYIHSANGKTVADMRYRNGAADAALIVEAVNAYALAAERAAPQVDGSHAFSDCLLCGTAVDDPEAAEYCTGHEYARLAGEEER